MRAKGVAAWCVMNADDAYGIAASRPVADPGAFSIEQIVWA